MGQSVTVRTSGGLSDADIDRMVQKAEQMREADNKKKEGVQAKNDAETLCYQVEKQLADFKDKISTADADELKKKMEDLRTSLTGDSVDPDEIKQKTKDLQEVSWKVTQQAYQQSSSEGGESNDQGKGKDSKFEEDKKE